MLIVFHSKYRLFVLKLFRAKQNQEIQNKFFWYQVGKLKVAICSKRFGGYFNWVSIPDARGEPIYVCVWSLTL